MSLGIVVGFFSAKRNARQKENGLNFPVRMCVSVLYACADRLIGRILTFANKRNSVVICFENIGRLDVGNCHTNLYTNSDSPPYNGNYLHI